MHQRRHAHGIARVVGEGQERAAVGDQAAVQRRCHSWRRSCRTRARRSGGSCRQASVRNGVRDPCAACCSSRSDRPSRRTAPAADADDVQRRLRGLARRLRAGDRLRGRQRRLRGLAPVGRQTRRSCGARTPPPAPDVRCGSGRTVPASVLRGAPASAWFQAARSSAGTSNGGAVQLKLLARRATSSTPSASPCVALVPALVGAPQPMMVLQQISDGRSGLGLWRRGWRARPPRRPAVDALHMPAIGLKALGRCRRRTSP